MPKSERQAASTQPRITMAGNGASAAEESRRVVRRFLDEVINQHKLEVVDELVSPRCTVAQAGRRSEAVGPERLKQIARMWWEAFPDLRLTIRELVAEGDRAAIYCTLAGTQRGEFMGIPATGKRAEWNVTTYYRLENGRITEIVDNEDYLEMFRQLGQMPRLEALR